MANVGSAIVRIASRGFCTATLKRVAQRLYPLEFSGLNEKTRNQEEPVIDGFSDIMLVDATCKPEESQQLKRASDQGARPSSELKTA